jgi:hypothetical protein
MPFQRGACLIPVCTIALFLVVVLSARATDEDPGLNSLSDAETKTLIIRLERVGCYGTCPAYTITIHGDGRLEYEGKGHVMEKGERQGRVEMDVIKALVMEFTNAKFWTLPAEYSDKNCSRYCTDMATAVTELSVKGASYRVRHYYGCGGAPKALFDLESTIDKSAEVERWTGDVSKAGPFGTTCWNGH